MGDAQPSADPNNDARRRGEMLRRATRHFLADAGRLDAARLAFVDDVLLRLIVHAEAAALAQLSGTLAALADAPALTVLHLAQHDDIAVAAPVLTDSPTIPEAELIAIAQTRSPAHLFAIAARQVLAPELTDALLLRADTRIVRRLARSAGARFSSAGFERMVRNAGADEILAGLLGIRPDLPPRLLVPLLRGTTADVRERMLEKASAEVGASIRAALGELTAAKRTA